MGLGSRQTVKRVCATLAVLRLVLRSRLHRIMTVKSFAVLLIQQAFALTISLSASRILACRFQRHARRFVKTQRMTTAIRPSVFASLATRALIAYMILLLA